MSERKINKRWYNFNFNYICGWGKNLILTFFILSVVLESLVADDKIGGSSTATSQRVLNDFKRTKLSCGRMIRLLTHPLPPSHVCKLSLFQSSCVSPVELTDGRGGDEDGGGDRVKAWSSINHSILSGDNKCWRSYLVSRRWALLSSW